MTKRPKKTVLTELGSKPETSEKTLGTLDRMFRHFEEDKAGMMVLKGHLFIEEIMTRAIEKFVWHSEYVDEVRLSFSQKLSLCRAMSVDDENNTMWDLIAGLNRLRNAFSHSLEGTKRKEATDNLRNLYLVELGLRELPEQEKPEDMMLTGILSMVIGYLETFEQEIQSFKMPAVLIRDTMMKRNKEAE